MLSSANNLKFIDQAAFYDHYRDDVLSGPCEYAESEPLERKKGGQAVRQESWQEIESESLLLGKAVTTRRVPES